MERIIVRDIQESEMSIFDPEGNLIVVTRNALCVNDILLQIRRGQLEGYSIEIDGARHPITKHGRVKGAGFGRVYAEQLRELAGFERSW